MNLGSECCHDSFHHSLPERVGQGLELATQDKGIKVILINILASVTPCSQIATIIASHMQRRVYGNHVPPVVVRLLGNETELTREILASAEIALFEELDEAIAKAVALSKVRTA